MSEATEREAPMVAWRGVMRLYVNVVTNATTAAVLSVLHSITETNSSVLVTATSFHLAVSMFTAPHTAAAPVVAREITTGAEPAAAHVAAVFTFPERQHSQCVFTVSDASTLISVPSPTCVGVSWSLERSVRRRRRWALSAVNAHFKVNELDFTLSAQTVGGGGAESAVTV